MRVWDIPTNILCRQHLLGEHREIHAIHSVLKNGKVGYSKHPETLRWKGKLDALKKRHDIVAKEMTLRGYNHRSNIDLIGDSSYQDVFLEQPDSQIDLLIKKGCSCKTWKWKSRGSGICLSE